MLFEESEHRGGFAAGENQTVQPGELIRLSHLARVGARLRQGG
jgi:hypothetical protein